MLLSMQGTVLGQIDVFLHKIYKYVAMAPFSLGISGQISGLLSTSVFDSWKFADGLVRAGLL